LVATSTATILFTDVEESTELRARLGEASADRLFVDHERRLVAAVERRGGKVLKTAGDGIMAAFESASDAVASAVDIQRATARRDDDIRVRIGIASGDVSWEGNDCFGLPVVTAARLEAHAAGGEILVSQVVRWLAGDRSNATFEGIGAVELKGLPEPVEAFVVRWEPAGDDAASSEQLPLPAQLSLPPSFTFVGRDAEWDALREGWAAIRSGGGQQIVLVGGEAGAGKSRLAAEFARACHDDGATVLFGGCDPELVVPYQPWVQALDYLLRFLSIDDIDADVADDLAPLAPLLPRLDRRRDVASGPRVDPDVERFRLFNAVEALFVDASKRWPIVLVIDDLHWAAAQTLALLGHVARAATSRMLVIATFRDTGDVATDPLTSTLADLRRVDGVRRVGLRGLDVHGVRSFVAGAVGHDLDAGLSELAEEVSRRTLGNAFFVGELWHHLVATGVVARRGDRWVACGSLSDSGVPDSIREVVNERLARLAFGVRRLVELVAVAGQRVELRVLRAAADMTEADITSALDELVEAGLLEAVQRPLLAYQFTHALVRDTVEGGVPIAARARLHLRVAEALESVHEADPRAVVGELARHYAAAAGLGADAKAVYYGRRAGEQADASYALDEAVDHFTTAIAISTPGTEVRAEILIQLGDLYVRLGRFELAEDVCREALDTARSLNNARLATQAAIGFGDTFHMPGVPSEVGLAMQEEAVEMLGDDGSALRAQLESSLALSYMHCGRAGEARASMAKAIGLARACGEDEALIWALGAAVMIETRAEKILPYAVEMQNLAARTDNRWYILSGTTCQMRALVQLGRTREARAVLEHHREVCGRHGILVADVETCCFEATLALAAGRFDAAETAADEALQMGTDKHPGAAGVYGLQMFAIRRAQGRLGEVAPILELAAKRSDLGGVWRPGLAVLFAEVGRLDEARTLFDRLAADGFDSLPRDALWPATVSFVADVCIAVGNADRAEELYQEMIQFEGENLMVALTICLGPADRLLGGLAGVLGREADAERHFGAAAALAEASESAVWHAQVQSDWARFLAGTGQVQRAARIAGEALDTAEKLGMAGLAERCRALASAPPLAVVPDLPDGLSARELDVLKLIAAGCSNREIGERLNISGNTAANHVRAILQKTGCANRTEAATYAARLALLD
jgi:class 3 adenylate cyclase/DNA-binding CsgD family transcriptional regulator